MKRLCKITCAVILSMAAILPVFAQSEETETVPEAVNFQMNKKGDQFIRISLGSTLPLNFPNAAAPFTADRKLCIGGEGSLGYHYFITDNLIVGGDAAFGFNVTCGSHVFNYIPITATITYQPTVGKFEFPLTLGIGFSWHTYIGYTYFPGLVVNPQAGVHYRINPSWSVGGDLSYMFLPEFNKLYNKGENFYAQFASLAVTARYYF